MDSPSPFITIPTIDWEGTPDWAVSYIRLLQHSRDDYRKCADDFWDSMQKLQKELDTLKEQVKLTDEA